MIEVLVQILPFKNQNVVKLRQGSGKDRQGLAKDGPARVRQGSARIGRGWPIRQKALKLPCLELTLK